MIELALYAVFIVCVILGGMLAFDGLLRMIIGA